MKALLPRIIVLIAGFSLNSAFKFLYTNRLESNLSLPILTTVRLRIVKPYVTALD